MKFRTKGGLWDQEVRVEVQSVWFSSAAEATALNPVNNHHSPKPQIGSSRNQGSCLSPANSAAPFVKEDPKTDRKLETYPRNWTRTLHARTAIASGSAMKQPRLLSQTDHSR